MNTQEKQTQPGKFSFERIDSQSWISTGPYLAIVGPFILLCMNLFAVFISHDGSSVSGLFVWLFVGTLVGGGFWHSALEKVEGTSYSGHWEDHKLYSNSIVKYVFYQGSKFIFGLITVVFGAFFTLWFLNSVSDQLNTFSSADRTIVILLGFIAFFLWRISHKPNK